MSESAPTSAVTPSAASPAHSSDHPLPPPPTPQNTPKHPIPEKGAEQTPQLHSATLSQKQQAALNLMFQGTPDYLICQSLRLDRKTLYTWKRRHPAFIAEMARRNHELWSDVASELRHGVADAVSTLRTQLQASPNDMTRLRAARTLIALVNSPRLAPNEPTTVAGVLDRLLRATQPPTAPTPADAPQSFTDAQRQALLDQLLAESAAAEANDETARQATPKPAPPTPG